MGYGAAAAGRGRGEDSGPRFGFPLAREAALEHRDERLELHQRSPHTDDDSDDDSDVEDEDEDDDEMHENSRGRHGMFPFASVRPSPGTHRACEVHADSLTRRFEHLVNLTTQMRSVFARIAEHVQTFYTDVVVPRGGSLATYDALVAAIANKDAAVDTALEQASTTASSFDCATDNPKEQVQQFRRDMQAVKQALHDLRRSVRDLIVAVRTTAHETAPSPEPSVSPEASPVATASPTPTFSPSPSP